MIYYISIDIHFKSNGLIFVWFEGIWEPWQFEKEIHCQQASIALIDQMNHHKMPQYRIDGSQLLKALYFFYSEIKIIMI